MTMPEPPDPAFPPSAAPCPPPPEPVFPDPLVALVELGLEPLPPPPVPPAPQGAEPSLESAPPPPAALRLLAPLLVADK